MVIFSYKSSNSIFPFFAYCGNSTSLGKCHLDIRRDLKNYSYFSLWFIYKAFLNPRKSPHNVTHSLHAYCSPLHSRESCCWLALQVWSFSGVQSLRIMGHWLQPAFLKSRARSTQSWVICRVQPRAQLHIRRGMLKGAVM